MQPQRTEQPTVVLVHGALTDASVWHPVIAELQRQGHRVIAPALPMRSLAGDSATCGSRLIPDTTTVRPAPDGTAVASLAGPGRQPA